MATEKVSLDYTVRTLKTGDKTYNYPRLVNVKTLSQNSAIQQAIDEDYLTGKFDSVRAIIEGFQQFIYDKMLLGFFIQTRFYNAKMSLNGQVDENGAITSATKLRTLIQPRESWQIPIANFSLHNIAGQATVSISNVASETGGKVGEIIKGTNIRAVGSNLIMVEGDSVVISCGDVTVNPATIISSTANTIDIEWPTALDESAVGSEVKFTFTLHGGDPDANAKVITKTVTLAAAE